MGGAFAAFRIAVVAWALSAGCADEGASGAAGDGGPAAGDAQAPADDADAAARDGAPVAADGGAATADGGARTTDGGVATADGGATDGAPPLVDDAGRPIEGDAAVAPPDGTDAAAGGDAGPTPPGPLPDGFAAPTDDPCRTLRPTIVGTPGPDRLVGTNGRDVIFGDAGDDEIHGNGGDDVICAGGGEDFVTGGDGDDYIDGGFGRDRLEGGAGRDLLHGRSGGDLLRGGPGNDALYGDLLDDEMYGDDGNDLLVGGHGIDVMHGGEGDDWLRGDTNRDEITGGAGRDTASFMTATPPGQALDGLPAVEGVVVDNRDPARGRASGDGAGEALVGVEVVIGSAFADTLLDGPGTRHEPGEPADRPEGPFVFLATGPRDLGLVVLGSDGDDRLAVSIVRGVAVVRATDGAGVSPGPGCVATASPAEVRCVLEAELRFILGYGGAGNDTIALEGNGFPREMTATLDGGDGDDVLGGHAGQDILFAGRTGRDRLSGGDGDDALLSESQDADVMDAGAGNDQLVSNYPCAGNEFIGGPGVDVGGFARVGTRFDSAAERRRQRIEAQIGFRAFQPAFCAREQGTRLADDIEILEGAGGDDELIGSEGDDTLWGWGGDDVIRGLGGNDTIEGHEGDDRIYGGAGRDRLRGNGGTNLLYARDGERDAELSCGAGGRVEQRDPEDPAGEGCR